MAIIDGKALSIEIKKEIAIEVEKLKAQGHKVPHLAAIIVGDNPASQAYVRNKVKSCDEVGFESTLIKKDDSISEEELLDIVRDLNEDPYVDGYIVQLPLPRHINPEKINLAIDPKKDVDGFHPMNFGRMTLGLPAYLPATPQGILVMLEKYNIETSGKKCVVIGRSNIVGMPMSILMSQKRPTGNCTVTIVHSRTENVEEEIRQADIVIAAIGRAHYLTPDMIKEGAVVIDVGINRIEDPTRKRGYRLVGDVDFDKVVQKASYITPVPGGVGPMTVTSLIMNTLIAAKREIYG
ncbi:MAG: methylenetetrahydrofolate dehydrogenase (NADP+)/methenyltetrahydrofolate cyclohydrolase [Saprospiraceae bacterium]|jgi:methylenetetrahydrofolate dehydrogenase (NADP+)/methenyltetrahydrofolate cyclohydrolase